MTTSHRVFVAIGAPLLAVVGIVSFWGIRNAQAMKQQISQWADTLEHSASPVAMSLPFIPMYIDGHKVGSLEGVVVKRTEPGAIDSLRIIVGLGGALEGRPFDGCAFQLDPDAFDHDGPLGFRRAVRCVGDTTDLVRFGTVVLEGTGREAALFLEAGDLPCRHMSSSTEACTHVAQEIRRLRNEVRDEVRVELRRTQHEIRNEIRNRIRNP